MKKKIIYLLAAFCIVFLFPQKIWAEDVGITYQTKESAKAGEKVTVEIDVSANKPITTLGLRLIYDSDKLTYESDSWAKGVKDVNAMTLVSDVDSNGGKVLNISMISDAGYQGSGNMVTLNFTAKGDYASVPVELLLRDITDQGMQDISASTSVSLKKQDNSQNSTENNNQNNSQNNDNNNQNNNQNNSESLGNTNHNTSTNSGGTNTDQTGESGGTSNSAAPSRTYQTGMEIMDFKVLSLGGICLAAGILCIFLKRKLSR